MKETVLLFHRLISPAPKEIVDFLARENFRVEAVDGLNISLRRKEKFRDVELKNWLEVQIEKADSEGWRILLYTDEDYPAILREISHPPIALFVKGKIDFPCFAVVGTRRATEYGRAVAFDFSKKLASYGITVVSGLAYGIDTYAHRGALQGGSTVAILGSGCCHIYPASNKRLAEEISHKGALITEFFPDDPPAKFRFPMRNRIIAGLGFGTLVVEAGERSGALITARFALEYGRDVFAVPGNIGRRTSSGTNKLIQQGARLVTCVEDIIGEYYEENDVKLSQEEELILSYIPADEAVDAEFIAEASSLRPEEIFRILLELEMKGVIIQTSGWRYRRIG